MEPVETQDIYCTMRDKHKNRTEFKILNKSKESKLSRTCNSKKSAQQKHKSEQLSIEDQDHDQDVVYEYVEIDSLVESIGYALNEKIHWHFGLDALQILDY
ncbi:45006_t:CDS:2 [Gigaspora margarita]|uniref:45006_t:CDS:1 n=1 Tax=Gigaspora margarita TaxID=4874 RepID=A0ABM8W6L2_GIGMA|nr:45006_t:CDS:2 [Gigaspora margarita]